ncbi:MAG: hypothetical protein Q9187_008500, partial [Circinaria calcarea]
AHRLSTATPAVSSHLHESLSSSTLEQPGSSGLRMIRSSSMKGADAPAVELNNASIHHEKALMPILLRATDDVNPDNQRGDDIDIRHYVKLRSIPKGRPGDKSHSLQFDKKENTSKLGSSNSFASSPSSINSTQRFTSSLEFVQSSVLEAVFRCTQIRITSSIDKLAIKPVQTGKCADFYLKTYVFDGKRKTYMFLAGCQKELECTIFLREGKNEVLGKIERITEFLVYVVNNFKFETSLMRDEFASIPSCTGVGSLSSDKETSRLADLEHSHEGDASADAKRRASDRLGEEDHRAKQTLADISNAEALTRSQVYFPAHETAVDSMSGPIEMPEDIPLLTFYCDIFENHKTKMLSASPFVKFMQPDLLMRARKQERRLCWKSPFRPDQA